MYQVLTINGNNRFYNNDTCGFECGYEYVYYDFSENGYKVFANDANDIVFDNGNYVSKSGKCKEISFDIDYWNDIIVLRGESKIIQEDEYIDLCIQNGDRITYYYNENFFAKKRDAEEIISICKARNEKKDFEMEHICSYIDNDILDMAENLLNIAEEDVMLDYRVVERCRQKYSHIIGDRDENFKYQYPVSKDLYGLKGRDKKEAEKNNEDLRKRVGEISTLIENLTEIIAEEKSVKIYIARAIVWEAIQEATIKFYSQKWYEQFEGSLNKCYDEIFEEQSKNIDKTEHEYIKEILLYNNINISLCGAILAYFLIAKQGTKELLLYDCWVKKYNLISEEQKKITSMDFKQRLKTKQIRKITQYTINDIDLMNGFEFEEFVSLLFRRMGYSTQMTQKSGDQGIDVIAVRNRVRIGIQAKCYSNSVGNAAIQEATAGKKFYDCDKVLVITNNYFTSAAIELADSNGVVLWNRDFLKEKIKEHF